MKPCRKDVDSGVDFVIVSETCETDWEVRITGESLPEIFKEKEEKTILIGFSLGSK